MIHSPKAAWRWFSVQATIAVGLLAAASDFLPEIKEHLPEGWYKWAALLILAARLIKQKGP